MHEDYLHNGLSPDDVAKRKLNNKVNFEVFKSSKSIFDIVAVNLFNYFNYLNIGLALIVILSGHYRNMLFIFVVVFNTVIGIYQEIKAKIKLDRLRLLIKSKTNVLRNGYVYNIDDNDLVLDDLIILNIGDQVPSDAKILEGELLTNESFLTGESDPVFKYLNDEILAGSFILGGKAKCQIIRVNKENSINKMLLGINARSSVKSELKRSLDLIIKTLSIIIVPLGMIIFLKQYFIHNIPFDESLIQTVASMVGMIPEGLILLTSVALSVGAIKLTRNNTLVQELYSLEMMARTDVLCLDKTGTVTDGKMEVVDIIEFKPFERDIIASIIHKLDDSNQTAVALRNYFKPINNYVFDQLIHFNPTSKSSGAYYHNDLYLLGAYEYIVDDVNEIERSKLTECAKQGNRIISISKNHELVAAILLKDTIRKNAKDIIKYLYSQNIDIKIISGDNQNTLENIARVVNLKNINTIDCHNLKDEELSTFVETHNIFARVSPSQKQLIIKALQNNKHTVGMMGDGVNDVMALNDADFSISVLSAAPSAKNVANVILMDDDFAHIPDIIKEGRRVINNIQRTSTLFLIKTCLSILLTILTIFFFKEYPFVPIQLTLISSICIGIPSFFLSLEAKYNLVEGNFLANILKRAIPSSIAIALSGIILEILISFNIVDRGYLNSIQTTITAIILIFNIIEISKPSTLLSKALVSFAIIAYFIAFSFFKSIFYFVDFDLISIFITIGLSTLSLITLRVLSLKELSSKLINIIDKFY